MKIKRWYQENDSYKLEFKESENNTLTVVTLSKCNGEWCCTSKECEFSNITTSGETISEMMRDAEQMVANYYREAYKWNKYLYDRFTNNN